MPAEPAVIDHPANAGEGQGNVNVAEQLASPEPFNSLGDKLEASVASKFRNLMKEVPGANPGVTPEQMAEDERIAEVNRQNLPGGSATKPAETPAPAQPAAPPAPDDEASIPIEERPPAGAAKATKEDWHRFRALMNGKVDAERKEKETLAKEIEALRTKTVAGPSPELEVLKSEKADLEAKLERIALAESPRFKAHYDGGIEKELAMVKQAAGEHGDEVVRLLTGPRSKEANLRLKEIKDELGIDGDIISTAAGNIRRLTIERDAQLAEHGKNVKALRDFETAERLKQEASSRERQEKLVASILDAASKLPEFKADGTKPEHAAFVAGATEFIRNSITGKISQDDAALLPVAAMKAQYLEKFELPRLQAEIKALTDRIASLTAASPRIAGDKRGGDKPAPMTAATYDPERAVKEVMDKFREARGGA